MQVHRLPLEYQARVGGSVEVIGGFSTDGLAARCGLVVLEDDRRFFPRWGRGRTAGRPSSGLAGPDAPRH